jgi:excisionase family DNA binding protein
MTPSKSTNKCNEESPDMDDLMTTRQLQELLHVDRITIYRMLEDGRLPGFKVGGQWRFPRRDIDKWLQGQRGNAGTELGGAPTASPQVGTDGPVPLTCLQAIQDILAEGCEAAAITLSDQGLPLTAVSRPCAFCAKIMSTTEGRQRCLCSWQAFAARPPDKAFRPCHAGLHYLGCGVPAQAEPGVVVLLGQLSPASLATSELERRFAELGEACGVAPEALRQEWAKIPSHTDESLSRATRLLRLTARTLAEMGRERTQLLGRLQRIAAMTVLD